MKKLAIVSSYNDMCGNATYTEALRKGLSQHYEVEVLPLKLNLLNKTHPHLTKLADRHIDELAEKLRDFDYVNIQFEMSLYGTEPKQVYRRFKVLAGGAKKLLVTMHRFDPWEKKSRLLPSLLRLQIKKFLRELLDLIRKNRHPDMYADVITFCKKRDAAILVHTKRERFLIEKMFSYEKVYDHPLSFFTKEDLQRYKSKTDKSSFAKKHRLEKSDFSIGVFGFISWYKAHHIVVKAMRFLPKNYKLLIFGSQHPASIVYDEEISPYMARLLKIIEANGLEPATSNQFASEPQLSERVNFCGSLNDEEFINALLCCDLVILPYIENNQSGSGIASLVLETGANAIFSQNYAFMELQKYAPGCIKMFSIGNYIELAECIKTYTGKPIEALEKYFDKYNLETNVQMHSKIFAELKERD